MAAEICSENRYTRTLFIFMCYAFIGSIIFAFMDYEKVKNDEKRERLDEAIKTLAEKVTALANDPTQKIDIESMKRHVEQAYAILRSIDGGDSESSSPTEMGEKLL